MIRMSNRRHASGFTLIEVMIALVIMLVAFGVVTGYVNNYIESRKVKATAGYLSNVAEAGQKYIADNHASLRAAATATSAVQVTHAQLLAGGYLPAGTGATTPHGQTYTVRVIEPTAGKLEGIVRTQGNTNVSGMTLRRIAADVGVMGGYVEASGSSAVAYGAHGAWVRSLEPWGGSPNANQSIVALFVSDLADNDDFLHRSATAGRPELNRMNTGLDMGGNRVSGVSDLTASGTVHALAVNGQLTHSSGYLDVGSYSASAYGTGSGRMWWNADTGALSLQNTRGGRGSVILGGVAANERISTSADVTATGNITSSGTLFGSTLDVANAYNDGWYRSRGASGWYSQTYGGGWHMSDTQWLRSYNGRGIYTAGQMLGGSLRSEGSIQASGEISGARVGAGEVVSTGNMTAGSDITAHRRLTAGEYLLPHGNMTCNAACATNGLIGRTLAGQAASCISGTWRCLTYASSGGGGTTPPPPVGGCLPDYPPTGCPVGYTPMIGGCRNDRSGMTMVCP